MKHGLHHFTPESNQQSAEWTAAGESCPKRLKMQTSTGTDLVSVFWDVQGILFIKYLQKERTINSKYYMALLVKKIAQKWPQMKKTKVLFSPRQCIVSQVDCNDGKPRWIALQIASASTLFSRFGPPVTTGCLQTSKECSRERDLAPMKKWY